MEDLADEFRRYLSGHGLPQRGGVSAVVVAAFERQNSVSLPEDMRTFILAIDGMEDQLVPEAPIRLWPLGEIVRCHRHKDGDFFVVADYSLSALEYGMCLSRRPAPIVVLDHDPPVRIAPTYSEFVRMVLANSGGLFPTHG